MLVANCDTQLLVWNQRSQQPVLKLTEHTAAVKAITWSPHQCGLLASGGGTADRCIRFWNTTNGNHLNHVDTGSQVCIQSTLFPLVCAKFDDNYAQHAGMQSSVE